jgi:hypothetical protein
VAAVLCDRDDGVATADCDRRVAPIGRVVAALAAAGARMLSHAAAGKRKPASRSAGGGAVRSPGGGEVGADRPAPACPRLIAIDRPVSAG